MFQIQALAKQIFGARYEALHRSLAACALAFLAVRAADPRLTIAPTILCLTSGCFSGGVMWQLLQGRHTRENLRGLLALPSAPRRLVACYLAVLSTHTLLTKMLPVWALFAAAARWEAADLAAALFCAAAACAVAGASYWLCRRGHPAAAALWCAAFLACLLLCSRTALLHLAVSCGILTRADAYDFYPVTVARRTHQYRSNGSVCAYLLRYLWANRNYLANTAGLCAFACLLPLLFGGWRGMMFGTGLALLCLNTPLCTLLSANPDLLQAVRTLPGQAGRFGVRYVLFLFLVNTGIDSLYLISWQVIDGGIGQGEILTALIFALQSALWAVLLEWYCPLRSWKTESDLWHHPRKYLVPLAMLLVAALINAVPAALALWCVFLVAECGLLLAALRLR